MTFQWSHADTNDGNFTDIDGATESTYFPTAADNGKFLKLTASYKDRYVRDEYLEITPVKTVSVVSDDAISLYTRTFASSLHITDEDGSAVGYQGEPNLSQPFRTGPQPAGYMIKKVEVRLKNTPDYDPDEFEVKITTTPDVTEESTVATLIQSRPDRQREEHVPGSTGSLAGTEHRLLPGDDPPQPNPPAGLQRPLRGRCSPGSRDLRWHGLGGRSRRI